METVWVVVGLVVVGALGGGVWWVVRRGEGSRRGGSAARAWPAYPTPPMAFEGDSRRLQSTAVVPSTDTRVPQGKNVIWSAAFQIAWDRLRQEFIHESVRISRSEAVAERLNRAQLTPDDLPEDAYYARSGLVKHGIAERIRREMRKRFEKEPADLEAEGGIVAYAYLQPHLGFTHPFFEYDREMLFTDSQGLPTPVSAFGLYRDQAAQEELCCQVEVLYETRDEFAVDLCRDSQPSQVILACVRRKDTLQATLEDLGRKMADHGRAADQRRLGANSVLLAPNLHWGINHHFLELEGPDKTLFNRGFEGQYVDTAMEAIDFRLDCGGAASESKAKSVSNDRAAYYCFDRPFLVVVQKRGARSPYFMMWVDNAELLSKPG